MQSSLATRHPCFERYYIIVVSFVRHFRKTLSGGWFQTRNQICGARLNILCKRNRTIEGFNPGRPVNNIFVIDLIDKNGFILTSDIKL